MIIIRKCCRDDPAINAANGNFVNFNADNANTDSFKIKEKITGKTGKNGTTFITWHNFCRTLEWL